jgi:MbtH protein
MTDTERTDDQYFVVRNHEEQYSIWRTDKPVPAGWDVVGSAAEKESCLTRIGELWTDMRPASLRRSMEAEASG